MKKYIISNIDGIAKTFYPVGLITFTKNVANENNDNPILITSLDCIKYIEKYCNNLDVKSYVGGKEVNHA